MTDAPLKQRAIKGALWSAVGGNGAQVLAFVMFVAISRVVGPDAFGVVAICLLLIELTRAVASECVAVNLVAEGRFDRRAFDAGLVLTMGASLVVALALISVAPLLALALNAPSLTEAVPKLAPLLLVHAYARLLESELTLRMAFRSLAFRSVSAVLLGGLTGIAAAYAGWGVDALVLQQWVGALAALAMLMWQTQWRPDLRVSPEILRLLAARSAALAPANLIANLRLTLDGLAVAAFSGATVAGLYNLAKRTRLALQLGITSSIGRVALPAFGQLKHDRARTANAANQAMRLGAVVAYPIFLGIAAIAPELVHLALGPEWDGAATPMTLLMIAGALSTTTGLFENMLLVHGRRGAIVALQTSVVTLLLLLIIVVGAYGPAAIASAVIATSAMHNIAAWNLAAREVGLKLRDYFGNVWTPFLISVVMLALVSALRAWTFAHEWTPQFQLLCYVCAGAFFYLGAAWLFARPAMHAVFDAARIVLKNAPAKS